MNLSIDRPLKGKSLLQFPDEYTVIDIETTGLDPKYDEIIELSAVKVSNDIPFDSFETLIKPNRQIDGFIEGLTGISNKMVKDSPKIEDALPGFMRFIGNSMLLGQNVNFDINFLYDLSVKIIDKPLSNDFVDLMRISRRAIPEIKHHGLVDVASYFNIDVDRMHRAKIDCEITNSCFAQCKTLLLNKYGNLQEFYNVQKLNHSGKIATNIVSENDTFDEDHPFYHRYCVFTGALSKMPRREAMQLVANVGGICEDGITMKTNFLIVGAFDYSSHVQGGKSGKIKKAEKYILKGNDLKVISENVFYDMI